MNNINRIFNSFKILLIGGAATSILNFLTSSFIIKNFGIDFFGQYTFILAYFIFLSSVFSTQAWQPLVRTLQNDKTRNERDIFLSFYISELLFSFSGVILAIFVGNNILHFFNYSGELPDIGILIIIFSQNNAFFGYFRYKNKHKLINIIQILQCSLVFIFIFIFYFTNNTTHNSVHDFFIYVFVSYLISYLFSVVLILKMIKIKKIRKNKIHIKDSFKYCFPFYITILTDSPIRDLIIFIINKYFGSELVGFYRILTQIGGAYTKLTQPIYQASYSELVSVINNKKEELAKHIIKKIFYISFIVLAIISIGLIVSYKYWVSVFFTNQYINYYIFFTIYIIIQVIIGSSVIINSAFLSIANGWQMFTCTATINLFFSILLYILTLKLQFYGVLMAILIQVIMNISWKFQFLRKKKII
ncbi:lipopolysaccharide biosynthesis protein [Providencia hangzhouensis]|uniref:lipopolysaccharide biosynthesis protein n=1 Tax=Providencia TaxID=586 RepID=UPI0029D449EB|nr:oligosaccharide flippase family protein [Providencia sp. CIM-Carb-044]MDX7425545.1 oligosaccharide flippase family protein [Providencia sp. CIM-Carb-044]